MDPSSPRVVNAHIAGAPGPVEPSPITQTMSPQKGVNVHSGPDVEQFGHTTVGDGQRISDVRDGRIVVPGSSAAIAGQHCHHAHHTADGIAVSDPPKDYVHDGSTYATGASNEPYTDEGHAERSGLMTRIKEAIPGTREHKDKVAHEDGTAVYM